MALYPSRYYMALLDVQAVAASTWYIMVDRDDTTNYDHSSTVASFNVLGIDYSVEKASDGIFDLWVGVVLENDATNGTAQWIDVRHIEASGNPTDSTDRFHYYVDFTCCSSRPEGLCCEVVSSKTPWITGTASGDQTALQNDAANLANAGGGSSKSAVAGDIVLWVEEVTDGGTIDACVKIFYTCN